MNGYDLLARALTVPDHTAAVTPIEHPDLTRHGGHRPMPSILEKIHQWLL
ncbi:hypothetical protein [Streptomyces sp. NPDC002078]